MTRSLVSSALLLGLVVAAGACNGLLGNEDIVFDDPALDASSEEGPGAADSSGDIALASDAGCPAAACERIVFVTSLSFQGALGGVAGADAFCNQAAAEPGSMSAGACSSPRSASPSILRARVSFTDGSYKRTDGRVVAANWDQLVSGMLSAPIDHDETGALRMPAPPDVWTGTEANGGRRLPNCNDWQTSSPESIGNVGTWSAVDSRWTANRIEHLCSTPSALYCIER